MLTKNNTLNQWLWKWHVIAGLITLPFMLLLGTTGVIYLFKTDFEQQVYHSTYYMEKEEAVGTKRSYQEQLIAANKVSGNKIVSMTLPKDKLENTAFRIQGQGFDQNMLFINPYTAEQTGQIDEHETFMRKVRKLHGELLLNEFGEGIVELVASWFIVLILTGIYVWWPKRGSGAAGFFTIRTNKSKRIFWRDMHAVTGFWLSAFMLAILAGGMPWTQVFGDNLKWIQAQTDTGYPKNWLHSGGLKSTLPNAVTHTDTRHLSLDEIAEIAENYQLNGSVTITLPQGLEGVYRIANNALWLEDQKVFHIDQYSGDVIRSYTWDDVGILMNLRQVFMRFHQGEYGRINWIVILLVGLGVITMTSAGITSYLYRKAKDSWGIPKVPPRFKVDRILFAIIVLLGMLFPLFGASLLLLYLWENRNIFRANHMNNK